MTVCSNTWESYTGVAANSYIHRPVKHQEGEYSDDDENHFNGLESASWRMEIAQTETRH